MTIEEVKLSKAYLSQYHFDVNCIIDVGVAFGTPWLYSSFPTACVALIDPLTSSRDVLARMIDRGRAAKLFYGVAGNAPGELTLTRSVSLPGRSSLHERTKLTKANDETVQETVICQTLDQIIGDMGFPGPYGLKIDTEGHEKHVLEGAGSTLEDCAFVLMEMSLRPRFENCYKPSEIILLMRDHGFELIDIMTTSSFPRFIDVLFAPQAFIAAQAK